MWHRLRAGRTILAALLVTLAGCDNRNHEGSSDAGTGPAQVAPRRGGEAVVLLASGFGGTWPSGLDPATNITGGANSSLMNAIYSGLFQLRADDDGRNARTSAVLATSYEFAEDGRAFVIHLRRGVTFSDGTPFDAEAVRFNIERSLKSPCSCSPRRWPWAGDENVTVADAYTVVLHFARPYGSVVNAFAATNLNWIASPTALRQMGEDAFRIRPVGAGPFRVVSNQLSARLTLERNPLYWEAGKPYLDRLTFQSIGSEQAGYQALLAGDAQAFEAMSNPLLLEQSEASRKLTVTRQPATSPLLVQLNTTAPPFNNLRAREAVYYATDVEAIRKGLFRGMFPVSQSFTAPEGLFHHAQIPGYRTYDLNKAKAIVRELGGLRIKLGTIRLASGEQIITALQSQWKQAGMDVTIESYDLGTLIQQFQSREWQAMLQTAGSYDPDIGVGLSFRFSAKSVFSGVSDTALEELIDAARGTADPMERDRLYLEVSKYLSDNAYGPFLFAQGSAQVTRGLRGPGLTTRIPPLQVDTSVLWQDVWLAAP